MPGDLTLRINEKSIGYSQLRLPGFTTLNLNGPIFDIIALKHPKRIQKESKLQNA